MNTQTIPEWRPQDRLRRAMEFAGLTPLDLADRLHVSENTVYNYLSGRTQPRYSARKLWAEECGVPAEWIEGGVADHDAVPLRTPRGPLDQLVGQAQFWSYDLEMTAA